MNKRYNIQSELEHITMPTYGCMLNHYRILNRLTLSDFKSITGIDKALMSKYENDKRNISSSHADILDNFIDGYYEKEIQDLLNEKKRKKKIQ